MCYPADFVEKRTDEREKGRKRERETETGKRRERERVFAIVSFRLLPFVIFLVCFSLGDKRLAVQMLERERDSERGREREGKEPAATSLFWLAPLPSASSFRVAIQGIERRKGDYEQRETVRETVRPDVSPAFCFEKYFMHGLVP